MNYHKLAIYLSAVLSIGLISVLVFKLPKLTNFQVSEKAQQTIVPSPSPNKDLKVKVSIPYWDQERAVVSFKNKVDKVDTISLFWYFTDKNGEIRKYQYAKEDKALISFAKANNIKVEIVITNLPEEGSWDSKRVEKIIESDQNRKKHIDQIVQLTDKLGVDGVDIDYEQLDNDLKDDFSEFIQELGSTLDEKGKFLGVALHPKSDDGIGSKNGSRAQDWQKLSQGADNLYIMAFGEHWDEGEPGPIASQPWVARIVNYAQKLKIDRNKFYLSLPLYGYSWEIGTDNNAKGLTYNEVSELLTRRKIQEKWDDEYKSPHFTYETSKKYEVWFENAQSIKEKMLLAEKSGFGGVSFWRLGGEDPKFWDNLQTNSD